MEKFLDPTKKITPVGDELYAFFLAHELIKTLSEKAIKNLFGVQKNSMYDRN